MYVCVCICINSLLTSCILLFLVYSSVSHLSYSRTVRTLLPVARGSNSSLQIYNNASRYLDTPAEAVYLTVVGVGASCQLTNATVDASILERDIGKEHCWIFVGAKNVSADTVLAISGVVIVVVRCCPGQILHLSNMLLSQPLPLCITGMNCAYIHILSLIAYDALRQSRLIWLVRTRNCPFLQSSFFVLFCLLEVRPVGELVIQPLIIDQLSAKVLNPLSQNLESFSRQNE